CPPSKTVSGRCAYLELARHFLRIRMENADKAIQIIKSGRRSSSESITPKMGLLAPIPSASVSTATSVEAGFFARVLNPKRRSCRACSSQKSDIAYIVRLLRASFQFETHPEFTRWMIIHERPMAHRP